MSSIQLDKIKRTNVFNDTFYIWHDGPFGTINGFRMGKLPTQSVLILCQLALVFFLSSFLPSLSFFLFLMVIKKYNTQVDWVEINAGWGQCALLLSTLATKYSFVFTKYQPLSTRCFFFSATLSMYFQLTPSIIHFIISKSFDLKLL